MNRDELKAWLDRKPPPSAGLYASPTGLVHVNGWWSWFEPGPNGHEYLGEVSARTGPDPVNSDQKCTCEVCHGV